MPRKIQRPDDAVELSKRYGIKGGLSLELDEVVVPVHVVNPDAFAGSAGGPDASDQGLPGRRPTTMWADAQAPANGAGQVSFVFLRKPVEDPEWIGRRIVVEGFSISDSGGLAAFFHAGLGNTTGNVPSFIPLTQLASSGQVFPAGPVGSRFNGELNQISVGASSIAAGPFPGYNFGRWNKAGGNSIYTNELIHLGWELGDVNGAGTANNPGNNVFWLLNGTSNQFFRATIVYTIYPSEKDLQS